MAIAATRYEQDCPELLLVYRAQAGDRDAFDQLAKHYRPLLFALAFLRTSHTQAAEDLVQDVLTTAWRKLPTLADTTVFLPWLKVVMANACNSWHRQERSRPASLNDEDARPLSAEQGLPLKALLAQEQQRELRQALQTLPQANRLALLMHIWGQVSYDAIASLTGVPASTVDGRIYRAKRQLRRLLSDSGTGFLGEGHPQRQKSSIQNDLSSPRRNRMSSTTSVAAANDREQPGKQPGEQPLALVQFTRRFSLMLDAGVPVLRALEILEELPSLYGEAIRHVRAKVQQGECLSLALSEMPDLFPRVYVGMIRAGEVSRVLEESAQRLTKVLTREWRLANRHPSKESPLFLLLPMGKSLPGKWEEMSGYQQTVTLSLFFESFGTLLQSGVPIVQAMRVVADLLPPVAQEGWAQVIHCVYPDGAPFWPEMKRMGIFPDYAVEMIRIGEEGGCLDSMMHRLAESFEDDLEYQRHQADEIP